jgi:RND family efflux transporter MFP subunit
VAHETASIVTVDPVLAPLVVLTACKRQENAEAPAPRPVRTVTVAPQQVGETFVLTGHVQAEDEAAMAFRIGGRMIERPVNVGDRVEPGQILAKLDPQDEVNALRSAQASLTAARAAVTEARAAFERQRTLLAQGHTPRAQFDAAERALATTQSQVDDGEAQVRIASDRVSFTMLTADAAGTVTARGAEPGEVVQAGQMVVQLARKGGRDAVFDVPASMLRSVPPDPKIVVSLADDPAVRTTGRVREVAPQADPVTRTFQVKVGLADPPDAMRLGSTVNGSVQLDSGPVIAVAASALTASGGQPSVWVVDPKALTVAPRNIEVLRYDPGIVVVAHGLDTGDIVVTAGVQALHSGQKVRLLGPAS